MSQLKRLIQEVHRRSLWQVLLIYLGGAWAVYEAVEALTPRLLLPEWLPNATIVLFLIGLPIVLATAFIRDGSPGGGLRENASDPTAPPGPFADESPGAGRIEPELPLVGREPECEQLDAAWEAAVAGRAGFVLITGEAGIGKTRLAEERLVRATEEGAATARTRCFAAEGRLAYGPVADWLRSDALRAGVRRLDATGLSEVARILPELLAERPDLSRPEPLTESWQRRQFLEFLARAVLATRRPVLLVIDDLQWCDRETLEWIRYLLHVVPGARLMVLGTARLEEVDPDHPLNTLILELRRAGRVQEIALDPLEPDDTATLGSHVVGGEFEVERATRLHQHTRGNPLFVVESLRAGFLDADEPSVGGDAAGPSSVGETGGLPPKVRAVIEQRLSRLSTAARELAQLAATIGRDFSVDLLAEAADRDEDELVRALDELWRQGIIREHGPGGYDFAHDGVREAAYAGITPVRRPLLHRRVGNALESIRASDLDAVSSQLAAHYEAAGLPEQSIAHRRRAADVAQAAYAHEEAIHHLDRALRLLEALPGGSERDETELKLLTALGGSLAAARGWAAPEVGKAYERARILCERDREATRLLPVLWGLQAFQLVRADLGRARETSETLLRHAEDLDEDSVVPTARATLGFALFHLGELADSAEELELAARDYDRRHSEAPVTLYGPLTGVLSLSYLAHVRWHLGDSDRSVELSGQALEMADDLAHPFSRGVARAYAAMLHQFRGEPGAVRSHAEEALPVCETYGIAYYGAWAKILLGWGLAAAGEPEAGADRLRRGLEDMETTGARLRWPYYLGLLADVRGRAGDTGAALDVLSDAVDAAQRNDERWCQPELLRLEAELLRRRGEDGRAEARYRRALEIARSCGAEALELPVTKGLKRLQESSGAH